MIGSRKEWHDFASGAWRRALGCLLGVSFAFALIASVMTPSSGVAASHQEPGFTQLDIGRAEPTASDPSGRGLPGQMHCNPTCPCHAAIRADGAMVGLVRIASPLAPVFLDQGGTSVASAPPSEPPRT